MGAYTALSHIKGKFIDEPMEDGDGLHVYGDVYAVIEDCVVNLEHHPLSEIDECIAVTQGSEAYVKDSHFIGAGKIALIGCGDEKDVPQEKGKVVVFHNCVFKNGARRMPEVQDGMIVLLVDCIIENWCYPDRYRLAPRTNRGFGAWAHKGGKIYAFCCDFKQDKFWKGFLLMFSDLLGHLGNAYNEQGILGLLNPKTWIPGVCRGLTSSDGGKVYAYNCTKNKWWIRIENNDRIPFVEARMLLKRLVNSFDSRQKIKCKDVFNLD